MNPERDYLLGTHDEEIARLALQHRVWRPRALDAWQRAGFTIGQTLLDIGCGPGHATMDLVEIVGPTGRVVAVDQSRRFLDFLEATRRQRGFGQIETRELDLNEATLPPVAADGAWCRWVLAFVKRPRHLLERIAGVLRPGGVLVLHEYFDYATWRMAPRCGPLEEFVQVVMASWRADGGEPDIGLDLPGWLAELGFTVRTLHPIIEVIRPTHFMWQWPKSFIHGGLRRMVDLGRLTPERAQGVEQAFVACEAAPHTLMITPAVLEIIAVRG
jgi:SAM-dependent methyltransferase